MKDVTMLLLEEQASRFKNEITMKTQDEQWAVWWEEQRVYGDWFVQGELSDWSGFMDDQGDFVPVDWC